MNDDQLDALLLRWGADERAAAGPVPAPLVSRATSLPESTRRRWHGRALLPFAAAASVVVVVAGAALLGGQKPAQDATPAPTAQLPRVLTVNAENPANCPECVMRSLSIYDPQSETATAVAVDGPDGAVLATTGTGDGATFYISRLTPGRCTSVVLRLEVRDGNRGVQTELFRPDGVVYHLAVSPDGETLAYVTHRQQPGMEPGSCGRGQLRLRDLAQGTERTLPPEPVQEGSEGATLVGSPSWNPAGDRLLFVTQECCLTTTTVHAVRPAEIGNDGHLRSEVLLRDSDIGCVLHAVEQRPDDLLIDAEACGPDGQRIDLVRWNEKDRTAHRLATGKARTTYLSYRNGSTLAERDGEVGLLSDDGEFTRLVTGYLPAW